MNVRIEQSWKQQLQEEIDKTTEVKFMYSLVKKAIILSYKDNTYIYRRGSLTEAFGKAKANREKSQNSESITKLRKQNGVIDSVIKKIRYTRNEE